MVFTPNCTSTRWDGASLSMRRVGSVTKLCPHPASGPATRVHLMVIAPESASARDQVWDRRSNDRATERVPLKV